MMIPYVTYAVREVGMLSRSGSIERQTYPGAWTASLTSDDRDGAEGLHRLQLSGGGCQGADAWPVLLDVLVGVIRRTHERARGDVLEAEVIRRPLQRGELLRRPVADHRQVALGRAQVLAHGEDLDARLAHLAERVDELLVRLAEADHQA